MKKKFCFILTILISLVTGCTSIDTKHISAYEALYEGNLEEARYNLVLSRKNYIKSFLYACLELNDGNLKLAKYYANRLLKEKKDLPDAIVLNKLIDRRRDFPKESWLESFSIAWQEAGSPQLSLIEQLTEEQSDECLESEENEEYKVPDSIKGTPNEILLGFEKGLPYDDKSKFIELCLKHSSPQSPLEIKLLAFYWLNLNNDDFFQLPDELFNKVHARRTEIIQQLSSELPLDIKYAAIATLDKSSDRDYLTLEEIEFLENIMSRPRLAPSRIDLYNRYLERYTALDINTPHLSAWTLLSFSDNNIFSFEIKRKIEKTAQSAPEDVKRRLAIILEDFGKAHLKRKTIIDILISITIYHSASEIIKSDKDKHYAESLRTFSDNLLNAGTKAGFALFLWPINSLNKEASIKIVEDEVFLYQTVAGIEYPEEISEIIK